MIRRSKPLKRKTPVRKKKPARARVANPFKVTPVRDEKFLRFVRDQMSCLACGAVPVDPHHVTTRKAGGGDVAVNIMPLCRDHHREIHRFGMGWAIKEHPVFKSWLVAAERQDVLDRIERNNGHIETESESKESA